MSQIFINFRRVFSANLSFSLTLAVFFCLATWSAYTRPFGHDEFEAIHTAWKMWQGEHIYTDFFQHHHPLYYPLLGWLIGIFGETTNMVLAARGLSLVMALASIFVAYRIATLRLSRDVALISTILLSTTFLFLDKSIEVRPDVPQMLTGLVAIYLWLRYEDTRFRRYLFLTAIMLFSSFLFLQKAIFLILLIGVLSLYRIVKREVSVVDFFFLWGCFAALLTSGALWFLMRGEWSEYWFLNWTVNTQLTNTFFPFKYLLFSAWENLLLWLMFLLGGYWCLRKRVQGSILFFALGLIVLPTATKTPFAQYYLLAMPFVAMIASLAFAEVHRCWPATLRFTKILMILSAVYPAYLIIKEVDQTNHEQLSLIQYVLDVTDPNDIVYDGDANFNLFRKDLDYFWFSVRPKKGVLTAYQSLRPYTYDPYLLITEHKPKLISDSFLKMKNTVIADDYRQSERYRNLWIRNPGVDSGE